MRRQWQRQRQRHSSSWRRQRHHTRRQWQRRSSSRRRQRQHTRRQWQRRQQQLEEAKAAHEQAASDAAALDAELEEANELIVMNWSEKTRGQIGTVQAAG